MTNDCLLVSFSAGGGGDNFNNHEEVTVNQMLKASH